MKLTERQRAMLAVIDRYSEMVAVGVGDLLDPDFQFLRENGLALHVRDGSSLVAMITKAGRKALEESE